VGFVIRFINTQQQSPLNVLDGENAYVSEALSAQFLGIGKKRKVETNYGIEDKFISRRLKSEFTETSR